MFVWAVLLVHCVPMLAATTSAQPVVEQPYYAPLNSAAALVEYANSSSRIILGEDRQRKFTGLALAYQRRISATHWTAWDYSVEVRPIVAESDPTLSGLRLTVTSDGKTTVSDGRFSQQTPIENVKLYQDQTFSGTTPEGHPFTGAFHNDLGRRWTYAPGLTPACFSVHILPARRLQPFLAATGGFLLSPRDIPEFKTSAFNFTFSFGGGVEWFRNHQRSWTLEYRVQHISNKNIGSLNPGVDSQLIRVGYRFGF